MAELVKPSAEFNRRAVIIESLCAGRTPVEIIKLFGYPRSTVYDIAKRYATSEGFENGSPSPARKVHVREKSTRTPEIIQRVQNMILEDPGTSLRKLASVLGVSETIVRRIAQEILDMSPTFSKSVRCSPRPLSLKDLPVVICFCVH